MPVLLNQETDKISEIGSSLEITRKANDPIIVVWHEKGNPKWYLGFYVDENDEGTMRVDHLQRCLEQNKRGRQVKSDIHWERPRSEDIQDVVEEQILSCIPVGDWIITPETFIYELTNSEEIKSHFESILWIKYSTNYHIIVETQSKSRLPCVCRKN